MSWHRTERGWMDSPFFQEAAYSERDGWMWLIGEAAYTDCQISVKGQPFRLQRGQLYASVRFISEKFQWSTNRVLRFLEKLKKWGMIDVSTETGQNLITICNYSKYQGSGDTNGDSHGDTGGDSSGDTNGDKQEEIYNTNKRNIILKPENVTDQTWADFKALRKAKKAPITESVLNGIKKESNKAGFTLEQALTECCVRGWQSFKSEWVPKPPDKGKYKMPSPAGG